MKRSGWLELVGGGLVITILLAWTLIGPLGWGSNSGSYDWWSGPGIMRGFGFPLVPFAMLFFCFFMMGGMMWHGGPHMHSAPGRWDSRPRESVSDILERRYSQGEITKAEFDEMKQALTGLDASSANEHTRD